MDNEKLLIYVYEPELIKEYESNLPLQYFKALYKIPDMEYGKIKLDKPNKKSVELYIKEIDNE